MRRSKRFGMRAIAFLRRRQIEVAWAAFALANFVKATLEDCGWKVVRLDDRLVAVCWLSNDEQSQRCVAEVIGLHYS